MSAPHDELLEAWNTYQLKEQNYQAICEMVAELYDGPKGYYTLAKLAELLGVSRQNIRYMLARASEKEPT